MARHNDLGKFGEKLALEYLCFHGYEILETNYRYSRAEIDLIVKKDGILIFVEVKTRSSKKHGCPEEAVSDSKIKLFMDAAFHYMKVANHEWEIRFDVIAIIIPKNSPPEINHLKDAFVPELFS